MNLKQHIKQQEENIQKYKEQEQEIQEEFPGVELGMDNSKGFPNLYLFAIGQNKYNVFNYDTRYDLTMGIMLSNGKAYQTLKHMVPMVSLTLRPDYFKLVEDPACSVILDDIDRIIVEEFLHNRATNVIREKALMGKPCGKIMQGYVDSLLFV